MTSRALIKILAAGNPWSIDVRPNTGTAMVYFNGIYVACAFDTRIFAGVEPSQITHHLMLLHAQFPYDTSKSFWDWYYEHTELALP